MPAWLRLRRQILLQLGLDCLGHVQRVLALDAVDLAGQYGRGDLADARAIPGRSLVEVVDHLAAGRATMFSASGAGMPTATLRDGAVVTRPLLSPATRPRRTLTATPMLPEPLTARDAAPTIRGHTGIGQHTGQ